VYYTKKQIIPYVSLKESTTENSRPHIYGFETINNDLLIFCQKIQKIIPYDFIGLDVAKTKSGYTLIEANRSPQFTGYFRETGINIAEQLLLDLLDNSN